ncbi:MAG: polysaccharide biosynthesis tyrosine autokinase, partial [Desulfobacterales bacterium]|nr:polysaccharide biosynthesis tyrosine autokinase [Desulfobacterales bacterium]
DKVFGVDRTPGLTDILLGSYPWRHTVKTITDMIIGKMALEEIMATPGLDNLHLITSGPIPPNPTELINSDRLIEFFDEAREEYDMILLDSCPILSAADAAILGTKVDGVLLVYRVGKVSRGLLKRSAAQLSQVKCNILGVILNGMKPDVSPDFQDYKYYSYYSYGQEGQDKGYQEDERDFSLVKKKDLPATAEEILLKREDSLLWEEGHKRTAAWRVFLMVVATAFLTTGILWQNGLLNPLRISSLERLLNREEVERPKSQRGGDPSFQRGAEAIPPPVHRGAVVAERHGSHTAAATQDPSPQVSVKPESPIAIAPPGTLEAAPIREAPSVATKGAGVDRAVIQKKDGRYPYSLSLAAFRTHEQVERAVALYDEKGLHPYWAKVDLGEKGMWFRVFAGHFEDMEQAQRFQQTHGLRDAVVKKTPYTNLIGTYASKDGLDQMAAPLKDLGYSAYAIKGQDGEYRLFVGAFITEEGARDQQQALRSSGIQSTVTER